MARHTQFLALVALAVAGCTTSPAQTNEAAQAIVSSPAVTTDSATYAPGQGISVTYSDRPGNQADWIAIAPAGAPPETYGQWTYLNGQTSGTLAFNGLAIGSYQVRAFVDDSFTVIATADFSVAGSTAPTISAEGSPAANSPITVDFSNAPGNALDWITVSPAGSSDTTYGQWFYTNGAASGTQVFSGLGAGNYEARMYLDDSFTVIARGAFTVTGATGASVSTDMHSYAPNQAVTVSFSGMPGGSGDWVAISAAGSADTSYLEWSYTGGTPSGSHVFAGLPAGDYEARVYVNDDFTVVGRAAFTVASPASTTTDASTYTTADPVVVSYTGLPGTAGDWVAIAVAGSADDSYVQWMYTGGQVSGMASFSGLAAGTYEARTYVNDSYTVAARSPSFTVTP